MPNAVYTYHLDAADAAGDHAVQQSGTSSVDTRKPLTLVSPTSGTLLAGLVSFVFGQPSDLALSTGHVSAELFSTTGGSNFYVGSLTRQANGTWATTWDSRTAVNGTYNLRTDVYSYSDSRGNTHLYGYSLGYVSQGATFTVDNGLIISAVADSPDTFSPNGDSVEDTTTISFTLSKSCAFCRYPGRYRTAEWHTRERDCG